MAARAAKKPTASVTPAVAPAAAKPAAKKPGKTKKLSRAEQLRQDYSPGKLPATFSRVLATTMADAQIKYQDPTICVASEASIKVIGVPLPALSMEYVIQNTVWPLERVAQIVGREGTCKSFFTFEVCRWFRRLGGGGILFENETKYSPEAAMSILGYDSEVLGYTPCENLEDWQSKMQWFIQQTKHNMIGTKKEKGPGKVYPVVYILDSLMGKLSAESMQNIETTGHVSRAHPLEALKITPFLKAIPSRIRRWPMALICTNHLKKGQASTGGQPERTKAGGVQLNFQETFELQLNRCKQFHISTAKYDGVHLEMKCYKNSLGNTGRKLFVDVHWWDEPDPKTGRMVQQTRWQWHAATTRLILNMPGSLGERLRTVVDLKKCPGDNVKSRALGATKNPISFHEAGLRINKNKAMKNELRKLLGIKIRKTFESGVDYEKQLKLAKLPKLVSPDEEVSEPEVSQPPSSKKPKKKPAKR